LRWRDAPREYGPHKTIYNRFVRWSRLGVFNKIFAELAGNAGKPQRLMIDATHLNDDEACVGPVRASFDTGDDALDAAPSDGA
jgi:transposase